jgi:pimeloyl-ACP methyl ester carboxylesterase
VVGTVCISGLAPLPAEGLDWYAGMAAGSEAELRAAVDGREALAAYLAAGTFDPEMFTEADTAALVGGWSWVIGVVERANRGGPGGMIDDDLAYVRTWGFDPSAIATAVLVVHGEQDRMVPASHGRWLAGRIPAAQLWLRPDDGHVSVLDASVAALDWLVERRPPIAASDGHGSR